MAKIKTLYACSACDYQTAKWFGCCPACQEWNTILDGKPEFGQKNTLNTANIVKMQNLNNISSKPIVRMAAQIKEWDRVAGGGIVPGSFIVVTGDPGIGKSTLLLQVANKLAANYKIFYFSSEESLEQVKIRANRLKCNSENILFSDQADLDGIINTVKSLKPDLIIIDSIQNCFSYNSDVIPGSINQLKESAFRLMRLAKEHNVAIIASGHITKEGVMAGPKVLEHMVDAVFYLQGEDKWHTRVLRAVKNRFGTVHEIGFFEMVESGMQEVCNINESLLSEISYSPGSVLISYIEGSRPILIELQALSITSKYGMPQRVISGIDSTQVVLIAAILEKYLQIKLSSNDIFFKVSGGFKIKGSACDLGIALALLSTYFQKPVMLKSLAVGEISLTGQIKPINNVNIYLGEAEKFGIKNIMVSKNQKLEPSEVCKIIGFSNVYDLLSLFAD